MKQAHPSRLHILYLPRWYPHRYDPMMGLFIERHGLAVSPHVDISVLYVHADEKLKGKTYEIVHSENGLFTKRIYFKKSAIKPAFLANLVNSWRFAFSHFKGIRMIRKERGKENLVHVHVLTRCGVIARINKLIHGVPYVRQAYSLRRGMDIPGCCKRCGELFCRLSGVRTTRISVSHRL